MKFIDKFIRTVEIAFRKSPSSGEPKDMDIDKQNTPPDDHDAEMDEAAREYESVLSGVGAQGRDMRSDLQTKKAGTRT
jgi:hypothetical protein